MGGVLAASLFFEVLQDYCEVYLVLIRLEFMTDNIELVTRQHAPRQSKTHPNTTSSAKFDLTEQIYLIHISYKLKSIFRHVKVNQDISINYNKLDLPTQLIVQSVKLAGKLHTFEDVEFHHSVNIMPAYTATLSIQGMDVTSN